MIGLVGLKSDVSIGIREKFSVSLRKLEETLINLNTLFKEVIVLSTCNRTEIYFSTELSKDKAREYIFEKLKWDITLLDYTYSVEETEAVEHLMKVACGFDSKILGEDQIIGQIRDAYDTAVKAGTVKTELQKLFQYSITCGKEFRTECQLYKIPVSAASIAVKDSIKRKLRNYMIIGYGEIGKLAVKYALDSKHMAKIYIVARDVKKVQEDELVKDNSVIEVINFSERKDYNEKVEAIISCTSASHLIVRKSEFDGLSMKYPITFYDLAVPRDIEESIKEIPGVELYDIDSLNSIDEENKSKRQKIMYENINIIEKYIQSFGEWKSLREIAPQIEKIKQYSYNVFEERYKVFRNKQRSKSPEELARVLIKSASEVYANRAIEVLKEEKLKGREKECIQLLEKIFSI